MLLYWALAFLLTAVVAGLINFGAAGPAAVELSRFLFLVLMLLFVVTFGTHLAQNG